MSGIKSFFKKGSRKTGAEEQIVRKISHEMGSNLEYKNAVDAYVEKNGITTNLEQLLMLDKETKALKPTPVKKAVVKPTETPTDITASNAAPRKPTPRKPAPIKNISNASGVQQPASKYSDFTETLKDIKEQVASPSQSFNPFEAPVIKRSYTGGEAPVPEPETTEVDTSATDDIPSTDNAQATDDIPSSNGANEDIPSTQTPPPTDDIPSSGGSGGDDIPPTDDIPNEDSLPENDFSNTEGSGDVDTSEIAGDDITGGTSDSSLGRDNLKDLSAGQKKKAVEKTADVIISGYAKYAPLPFKYLSKMSKSKVDILIIQGRINPNQIVNDGVTIKDYVKAWNDEVDKVFTPSQETLDEIREPLIEVLMEQEMALTPQQRLMVAIGQHVVEMAVQGFQFRKTKRETLDAFIKNNNLPKAERAEKKKAAVIIDEDNDVVVPPTDDAEDTAFDEVMSHIAPEEEESEKIEHLEAEEVDLNEE